MLEEFKKHHNAIVKGSTYMIAEEEQTADIDDL
jgi:hypothetical protein